MTFCQVLQENDFLIRWHNLLLRKPLWRWKEHWTSNAILYTYAYEIRKERRKRKGKSNKNFIKANKQTLYVSTYLICLYESETQWIWQQFNRQSNMAVVELYIHGYMYIMSLLVFCLSEAIPNPQQEYFESSKNANKKQFTI